MSLHINMTDDAAREIRSQRRQNMLTAWLTAVLGSALLITLLYIVAVVIPRVDKPQIVGYTSTEDNPASDTTVKPIRTQQRSSAPNEQVASIITANSLTTTNVATVPVNEMAINISQAGDMDFGVMMSGGDETTMKNPVGDPTPPGSALEGTFYDFKQTRAGNPTNITPDEAAKLMKDFISKKWNPSLFNKYYQAPTNLYSSHFYISRRSAMEAPKAYKCEESVRDSRWCAIYRGRVMAPKSGKFRFVGAGDDSIVVRFNKENVFDYGWYQISQAQVTAGGKNGEWYRTMTGKGNNTSIKKKLIDAGINIPPVTFYEYSSMPHWNSALGGLACGKTFEVEAGELYPIEILITEIPGGEFGVALMIEEVGAAPAKKDAVTGAPILPLFRTNHAIPNPKEVKGLGGDFIPFDPIGIVWKATND